MTRVARSVALLAAGFGLLLTVASGYSFAEGFPGAAVRGVVVAEGREHLPVAPTHDPGLPLPPFLAVVTAHATSLTAGGPIPETLLRRRANDVVPLASLTKLMSALLILRARPAWSTEVTFQPGDRRGGAAPRLFPGETLSFEDLWNLMLVSSDNDATAAAVRATGMTEEAFVAAMNGTAVAFGLPSTRFVDPTGLGTGNVSTAREFSVIARAAFAEPLIADALRRPSVTIQVSGGPRRVYSTDQQLKAHRPSSDGWSFGTAKTGYTEESGYNLAAVAEVGPGRSALLILLGSRTGEDRAREAEQFFGWAAGLSTNVAGS